ncbi:hypothetical protein [Streptacidiphilus sp. EB129]|uniref:hypothetical protein n=1 Tax=Streptacidiphilus sp. EB129 TaxID=3156262 RepID=UPI003518F1A6
MTTTTESEAVAAWIAEQLADGRTVTIAQVHRHTTALRTQHHDQTGEQPAPVAGPSRSWCWDRIHQAVASLERRS